MTSFKQILVPIDFSEPADRALDVAIAIASKFDASLTLLHASWLPPSAYAVYAARIDWPTDEIAKAAQRALQTVVAETQKRYEKTDGVIVSGEPWQAILEGAKERHSDLIVMGTHGRRGVPRMLLGSVAEKVVRLSPVPVLTISAKA
jgi:nucleotide-binding universal stress UspA family protein